MKDQNMSHKNPYEEYVRSYQTSLAYDDKFFDELRDRHKIMLDLIGHAVVDCKATILLDVCCSKGVFLAHVKQKHPDLKLCGIDLGEKSIEEAKNDPRLSEIDFHHGDILEMRFENLFDIITANNALMFFDKKQYERAVSNIWQTLRPGGFFFASDLYHPFDQDLKIVEQNSWYDGELITYHRSYSYVRTVFERLGAEQLTFSPFTMSKDLPREGYGSEVSYTIATPKGNRLDMRGIILQPFCHFTARKPV